MKTVVSIFLAVLILASCSTQRQLRKTFEGKPISELKANFGEPKSVIERENEKLYIFEKTEKLNSTEIGQGQLTLDPIITPKVTKTERYYFTVQNGIVINARFEEEYDRK